MNKLPSASLALLLLISGWLNTVAAQDFIEPPMVRIPGADFLLGSNRYADTQPLKTIRLPAFFAGQYEITIKEFALFVADTHYPLPTTCYHEIGYWWFENETPGGWSDNAINRSEFEPVSCIGYQGAVAYANWLAEKTGRPYRLLSEAEWEYLATASAPSSAASVCQYANIADLSAESVAQTRFHTSYVNLIGIESCNDGAATVNIVGSYQPNAWGVYDLIGNVNEFVADCYYENYAFTPDDGGPARSANCEAVVLRGGAWHWPRWDAKIRDAKPIDWTGVLEGFRLALDDNGDLSKPPTSSLHFLQALEVARENRMQQASIPAKISSLNADLTGENIALKWTPQPAPGVRYTILANQHYDGRYRPVATTDTPVLTLPRLHQHAYQYIVAASVEGVLGEYSDPVTIDSVPVPIPATVMAWQLHRASNALVLPVSDTAKVLTGPRSGAGTTTFSYRLSSSAPKNISLSVSGNAAAIPFSIYINDSLSAHLTLNASGGQTANIAVPAGVFTLTLETEQPGWQIDAISITD